MTCVKLRHYFKTFTPTGSVVWKITLIPIKLKINITFFYAIFASVSFAKIVMNSQHSPAIPKSRGERHLFFTVDLHDSCSVCNLLQSPTVKFAWITAGPITGARHRWQQRGSPTTQRRIKVPLSLLVDMQVTGIVWNWQAEVSFMH